MNYFTPFVHVHNQQKEQRPPERTRRRSDATSFSTEINRLLSAAVINSRFCNLLLNEPLQAIAVGFNGESFSFTAEEKALLATIQANTLQAFAEQLVALGENAQRAGSQPGNRPLHMPDPAANVCNPSRFRNTKLIVSLSS